MTSSPTPEQILDGMKAATGQRLDNSGPADALEPDTATVYDAMRQSLSESGGQVPVRPTREK